MTGTLLIFGYGYSGAAIGALAREAGWRVIGTTRLQRTAPEGIELVPFTDAGSAIAVATHIVASAAPAEGADPVLQMHGAAIATAPRLGWVGYLSTTGVYGDRQGGWVDEATAPSPGSARGKRRLAAEGAWSALGDRLAVDLFRLAGIYGPGRSVLDDLRAGTARRIVVPDHLFGRIHRDDIAGAVLAGMARATPGIRVLNLSDDLPAASADVVEEGARLLGTVPPPAVAYAVAAQGMSEMGRSFWAENRRVSSAWTQRELGRGWAYPTYREGLRAVLAAEQVGQ